MNSKKICALTVGILICGAAGAGEAIIDVGKGEYNAACASCHGLQGLGDGPAAEQMKVRVPDITGLAKANQGVFPFDRVYQIIDGRTEIKSHGSRDMPIWGQSFRRQSSAYFVTGDSESAARSRILALTEYVYRLQRK